MSDEAPVRPQVPDLDLIRPIGQGGFGCVWLAVNQTTGSLRAVKVVPLQRSGGSDPAGREITSIARLESNLRRRHPNLLNIHHVGKTAQHLFYVMDAADDVSGRPASSDSGYRPATLKSRLEGGTLSPQQCFDYARQLLTGLASLHQAGMIHRDVKPANCLFVAGQFTLADFGLLTDVDRDVSRVGTQRYMPPDGRMDTRADVYAAGLVIYEMVSGQPVDRFPRLGEKAHRLVDCPLLNRLVRLLLRACQPDPARRFQDAGVMLAELESSGEVPAVRRGGWGHRFVATLVATTAVLGLMAVGWWVAGRPADVVDVNFITEKPFFNAEIYLDDERLEDASGDPYKTPCTVKSLPGRICRVTFKYQGLPDLHVGTVNLAENRQIRAGWESP